MGEDTMLMCGFWDLQYSGFFRFFWVAMFGVAAADGQVQIEMCSDVSARCSTLVRDDEGLAFTNPYRGRPGITASRHQTYELHRITLQSTRDTPSL